MVADSECLQFKERVFGICYCLWALHHFPSPANVFSQLNPILKTRGKLAIIEPMAPI
ncbi:MAG: class I SAM-dependent methyltransferase [Nitrososphaerales archaeon]